MAVQVCAQVQAIYIEPSQSEKILKTVVPYEPEEILSITDLPTQSRRHPGITLNHLKFIHLNLSPEKSALAFCVAGQEHTWTGLYQMGQDQVEELTLVFEGTAGLPYWSEDGRYLAVEEGGARRVKYLEIFDLVEDSHCRLRGRDLKNKFFNLVQPWWSVEEGAVFFKVEYNNFYRKSLGLKPKQRASRIGKANPQCGETDLYTVKEFMEKYPQMAEIEQITLSSGDNPL